MIIYSTDVRLNVFVVVVDNTTSRILGSLSNSDEEDGFQKHLLKSKFMLFQNSFFFNSMLFILSNVGEFFSRS